MTNFYAQAKEKAKHKAKEKKARKPAVDAIPAGPGVFPVQGINVHRGEHGELMPTWVQNNARYHINLKHGDRDDVFHVTREGIPKIQYFFRGTGTDIEGVQPTKKERGRSSKKDSDTGQDVNTKRSFDDLPDDVQDFVRNNWNQILG